MTTVKITTRKIVYTSLFAAITFVATFIIKVPTPTNGYVNIGDAAVILGALALGPLYGAISAGIGSCLSDITGGYASYAPATFIIKFIMGAVCGAVLTKNRKTVGLVTAAVFAEIIMILGYFLYEGFVLGLGLGAAVGIPSNCVQGLISAVIAVILAKCIKMPNV